MPNGGAWHFEESKLRDQEAIFELGLILLAISMVAAGAFWIAGRAWGRGRRGQRYAAKPPEAGAIAPQRHQHIATVAAR